MIIQKYRGQLPLVTQPDHGDLAGQFAAQWGNGQFQQAKPYEDMVVAASEHELAISPYPCRESPIDLHVLGRAMSDRLYENAQSFKETYYCAARTDLTFILSKA